MGESPSRNAGRVLLLIGRLALAAVFLFAAYTKLRPALPGPFSTDSVRLSLSLFATQVDSYQLLPEKAVTFVAYTLPFFELILGLLLITGWQLRYVASLTSALLLGFFGVMLRTYSKGLEINCGCFGPGETLGVKTLLRDGSLLALSLAVTVGAFFQGRTRLEEAGMPPAPQPQKAD
jgi:uncharacterized membrane protein YphA (DoxX/SURF4 family)